MRTLLIGIDSGTQSTKVLVVDARDGKVLAAASQQYDLLPDLPPGAKEQHPHTWRDAAASGIRQALRAARGLAAEVKAIGVSGQQHGFVPLDKEGAVIRPAKLWCDTSTIEECDELTEKLARTRENQALMNKSDRFSFRRIKPFGHRQPLAYHSQNGRLISRKKEIGPERVTSAPFHPGPGFRGREENLNA